ncbi:SDR family NAD(P)-dependent oxidoreductase [Mycobacterium sp.]|uniref:SDR family NAD(P)-dependent oxidoreductase n=1 Tax=Mycobacterium sp. TaxID=1785 RepID=UPI003BAF6BA3
MPTRSALITGASRGIGREIAHRLAADGYSLTLSARHERSLAEACEQLRAASNVEISSVPCDLRNDDDVHRLAAAHGDRFGGTLDLLVLNAGVATDGAVADVSMKSVDLTLNVNFRAQFLLVQDALPLLRKAAAARPDHGGKVIALSSITGLVSEPNLAAYGASKAALVSLCETVTQEEYVNRVTASAVCPGYVDTDMTTTIRESLDRGDMLTAADVAEIVMAITRLSARAVVPSVALTRAGRNLWRA